jgi:hypothetical protein
MGNFFRLLCTFLLLVLPRTMFQACTSEGEEEDFRFWLFQPNLVNTVGLLPFTYSSNLYYTPNDPYNKFGDKLDTTFYASNVDEWYHATGKKGDRKDIHRLLYQTEPERFSNNNLGAEPFIQVLQQPENSELYNYLLFSKQCEAGMNNPSLWDEERQKHLVPIKNALLSGETLLQNAQKPFVKLRTAYQLMKLSQYAGDTAKSIDYYDKYIKNAKSSSWIESSAMFYYATAIKDVVQRNFWLAKTFEWSIDKRKRAVQLFEFEHLDKTLLLAKSNHEKAVLQLMSVLQKQGRQLPELEKIYALDPSHKDFNMLIEREVNKVESWLYTSALTYRETDYFDTEEGADKTKNLRNDFGYLKDLRRFIDKVVADGKQLDKAFLRLSLAHLSFIAQDFDAADTYLKQAGKEKSENTVIRIQLEITKVVNQVGRKLNADAEQQIVHLMAFLEKEQSNILDYKMLKAQLMRWFAERFFAKGEVAKGVLLTSKHHLTIGFGSNNGGYGNFYHKLLELGAPKDYEWILSLLEKKSGLTPFEAFLVADPKPYGEYNDDEDLVYDEKTQTVYNPKKGAKKGWDINKIKDYYGTYYLLNDNLEKAALVFKTIPADFWLEHPYKKYLSNNPFITEVRMNSTNPLNDTLLKCNNKADLVQKIIDLKKDAEQNVAKRAENYFLLGNVYYNMTQNGKAWLMSRIYSSNAPNCGIDKSKAKNLFKTESGILEDGKSVPMTTWALILTAIAMLGAMIWKKMFKVAFAIVGLGILGMGVYSYMSGRADVPKNYAFSKSNDDFFSCDKAKNWYLKAMQEENPTIAAAACYMAGLCEKSNLMYQEDCRRLVTKDFKDDDNQVKTPFKNPYMEDFQKRFGGKVPTKNMQSCKEYQAFLEKL